MQQKTAPRNLRIVRTYLAVSIGFGVLTGILFPFYAAFFVTFPDEGRKLIFSAGCVGAGALVGLVSFLIGRFLVLRFILDMARRLESLNAADADLNLEIPIVSNDCVGRLAAAFNGFLGKLRGLIGELNSVSDKTEMIGLELAANSTETSAASEQITRHMELINGQTHRLVQEVDTVDDARKQINDASQLVSRNIDLQSESLTSLSALIEDMVGSVKSVSDDTGIKISGIRDALDLSHQSVSGISQVSRKIRDLQDEMGAITALVDAIDDIAERIGVLGINASIEASRAGNTGKGFSVVAQEVRKLAESARDNSTSISGRLSELKKSVSEGSSFTSSTAEHLDSFLARIGETLEEIQRIADRLNSLAGTSESMLSAHLQLVRVTVGVTESMITLRDGSNSIESSMGVLLATADENMRAIEEISVGIREISDDVAHLNRVSSQNAESSRSLHREIAKFRLDTQRARVG